LLPSKLLGKKTFPTGFEELYLQKNPKKTPINAALGYALCIISETNEIVSRLSLGKLNVILYSMNFV
jgi:hypothetical protein